MFRLRRKQKFRGSGIVITRRGEERIKFLLRGLEKATKKTEEEIYKLSTNKWTILDVGINDGSITLAMSQMFKPKKIIGVDLMNEKEFWAENKKVIDKTIGKSYINKYIQVVDSKLDVKTSSVDLITCFQSIHHFSDRPAMFSELNRVLKSGGFLFIREHDVPSKKGFDRDRIVSYLENVHMSYGDDSPTFFSSRNDLRDELVNNYGFKFIDYIDYEGVLTNKQAIYHAIFRKK